MKNIIPQRNNSVNSISDKVSFSDASRFTSSPDVPSGNADAEILSVMDSFCDAWKAGCHEKEVRSKRKLRGSDLRGKVLAAKAAKAERAARNAG